MQPVRALVREALGPSGTGQLLTLSNMETLIVAAVALLLFVYLFVAMIKPEKF